MVHTKQLYRYDYQGSVYQNYTFHDPRVRGSCAGAWPYLKSYCKNAFFLLKYSSLLPGMDQSIKYLCVPQ